MLWYKVTNANAIEYMIIIIFVTKRKKQRRMRVFGHAIFLATLVALSKPQNPKTPNTREYIYC